MSNLITNLKITNLFDNKSINWDLKPVNVLVGKNGLGKSTILRLIYTTLTQEPTGNELQLCDRVEIDLENEDSTFATSKIETPHDFEKLIKSFMKSKEFDKQLFNNIPIEKKKLTQQDKIKIKESVVSQIIQSTISNDFNSYQFKKNNRKYSVEFISTVNMSANSINQIQTSDGRIKNFLDIEIDTEISRLIGNNSQELQNDLISSLNFFFQESNKTVEIINNELIVSLNQHKKIKYKNLSSGERQIIYIFLKVINANINNAIILMDEPEISLHLSWQESLLSKIREVNKLSQIIIVTHSPAIVMNGWMDSFIDIKDIFVE